MARTPGFFAWAALGGFAVWLALAWIGADPPPPDAVLAPRPVAGHAPTVPQPELPDDAPRVVVGVRELHSYLPPQAPPVVAVAPDGRTELPVAGLGGLGSDPFAPPEPARHGVALVAIDTGAEHRVLRIAARDGPEPARVLLGGRGLVRGQVLGPDGPLADAQVALGELADDGSLRSAATDAEGRFELDAPTGAGVPVVVQKPGFAAHHEVVDLLARDDREHVFRLQPAGVVVVQIASAAHEVGLARLYAVPPAGAVASELLGYPWFLQTLRGGMPFDAAGRAVLDDLPLGVEVGLVVVHPGTPVPAPAAAKVGSEPRPELVSLALGGVVRRPVVVGEPAAAVLAVVAPNRARRGRSGQRFLPAWLDWPGAVVGWSDEAGSLWLPERLPSAGRLWLAAPGHGGRDLDLASLRDADLVLPAWQGGGEPALVVAPPVAGVGWGSSWQLGEGLALVHRADESAVVALPRPGRYAVTLAAEWRGRTSTASLEVDATGPVAVAAPRLP